MQPLDALTLHHYAGELDVKLADGKVNKIQQPSHSELLLHLWVGGESGKQKLYINIRPEYAFCALIEDTSFLSIPEKAPNFCMVLRKHLTSARIKQVRSLPDERVLNILMDNYNELGQHVELVLSLELMGKNSNILLYDSELNLIIGCAHGVSEAMSRLREVSVGYPYVPPPRPERSTIRNAAVSDFIAAVRKQETTGLHPADVLLEDYSGIGKALLGDLFDCYPQPEAAYAALQELFAGEHLYPAVREDNGRFSMLPAHIDDSQWIAADSINTLMTRFFLANLRESQLAGIRHQFRQVLKAQEKKVHQRMKELDRSSPEQIEALRKIGDQVTIAASEGCNITGSQLEVTDYESGNRVIIEVDPTLTVMENAQMYYRRYKKALARHDVALQTRHQLETVLAYSRELENSIQRATAYNELDAIREDLESQGWLKPREDKRKAVRRSEPMAVTSSDGFRIYIGKSGLQNEQIVGRLSRPEDIWLHAHLIPGSHVLIKTDKQEAPNRTLEEAAMLAAWFSQARDSVNVPIVYTQARYVRKIPGSYPGHVNYTHEQALNITPNFETIRKIISPSPY